MAAEAAAGESTSDTGKGEVRRRVNRGDAATAERVGRGGAAGQVGGDDEGCSEQERRGEGIRSQQPAEGSSNCAHDAQLHRGVKQLQQAAAHNLVQIYKHSGAIGLARQIMADFLCA